MTKFKTPKLARAMLLALPVAAVPVMMVTDLQMYLIYVQHNQKHSMES